MRRADLLFSLFLLPFDFLMIILAGIGAYYLRFIVLAEKLPIIYQISFSQYFLLLLIIAFIWLIIFAISGLYLIKTQEKIVNELTKIFLACSTGILLIILAIFFKREFFSSRFVILIGWVLAIIFVSLERLIARLIKKSLFRKGYLRQQVIVVGNDSITQEIIKAIKKSDSGYNLVAWFRYSTEITKERLSKLCREQKVNELIQADVHISKEMTLTLLRLCDHYHIIFKYTADFFDAAVSNIGVTMVSGIPIIEIKRTSLDGWGKIFKRFFDLLFSSVGLIVCSPLFLVIGILIKLDSTGSIIISLPRVGKAGKIFALYKFRSMVCNADALKKDLLKYNERKEGPLFKMKNDPRITKIGKWLRRSSTDELAQLINVFKGEMSLVGPRPHEAKEVAQYQEKEKRLLNIKPGITGLSQVSGRSNLSFVEEVKLDTYYIENWSLLLDLAILLRTPLAVIKGRKAE
ncbi:MAG: sugar transferase [Candidatus Aenigmarchaeota archaeon]|nr:sugar transferase [Candidatus Aenigmarchaeota archaeon]